MDYGKTLNLPQTEFPMRGNLPTREPEFLKEWEEQDIYNLVAEKNAGKPKFILHDGPPYANGNIHTGHVLNKVLKDMIVKYKSMTGYDVPFTPGWDTHGLPIEQKAIKEFGINRHEVDKATFRKKCEEFAMGCVDNQRNQFKRLGARADWDNPYITLQKDFEAAQIGAFGEMAKKGYIYKGKKPVYWCAECETALAEAEVEYDDHKAPTIYVKFQVVDGKGVLEDDTYFVIWTTTPWTIPANLAICLHPDYVYALAEIDGVKMVVAKDLLETFMAAAGCEQSQILKEFKGADLELIECKHPLLDRKSLVILGDHVTLDAGTGCVHTAPGHGVEDFEAGMKYGLEILSTVDAQGKMNADAGEQFQGMSLDECNKAVIKGLEEAGAVMGLKWISHQYPHCWRCKKPIVFRATEQWFCSIEGFREKALEEIDKVRWIPSWGHDRIYNMVRDRSDWCISRQRTWGVPIPIFYCKDCGKEIITDETIKHIQNLFREHGSNIWFEKEANELIPEGLTCECGCHEFRKETDIMDVWFDSGSSHLAVLDEGNFKGQEWPADLYLEGSDQHRGWFNSSLNVAVACKGSAPYKAVLTHGFIVDDKGKKMSKSLGNAVDPHEIIDKMGADVLRLWVASADYRSDLSISNKIMKQVAETYRKIRNTSRFLLSNLYDFNPATDCVDYKDMPEIDRWMMHRLQVLIEKVLAGYENYEFHVVYHSIHKFCVTEMSNLYLDITKDTLYSELPDNQARRSVQTVMYHTIDALVRLLTPVLAYTTEEIYDFMPKADEGVASVQLLDMPKVNADYMDEALNEKWLAIYEIKDEVAKHLEDARKEKTIGNSIDAKVDLYAEGEKYELLKSAEELLGYFFKVSQFALHEGTAGKDAQDNLAVEVTAASGHKCERCWIYTDEVSSDNPDLCPRCGEVMKHIHIEEE